MQVEKLLAEVEAAEEEENSLAGEALDGRARMLERLASEVSRLNYYSTRGKVGTRDAAVRVPLNAGECPVVSQGVANE